MIDTSPLCADICFRSLHHVGEELCGDHVEVVEQPDGSSAVVLADGLGSGVKASILSTLTAKILSTMAASGLPLEDCVSTLAATLPIDEARGVAYSTFTLLRLGVGREAELIEFDNPPAFLIREGESLPLHRAERSVGGKLIYQTRVSLREGDTFFLLSDGCPHAGIGQTYNFGWEMKDIIDYISVLDGQGYTARMLCTILLEEVDRLYGGKPGDDATVCVARLRRREPVNLLVGPPANPDDDARMLSQFFSKAGKHIVCGGTTSGVVARYLQKPVVPYLDFMDPDVPPMATIEGVDLTTEGVVTLSKTLDYAKDYLKENQQYNKWNLGRDGASCLARLLFEEATDARFFVGRAVNPAHQNPNLPISFNIKMRLVDELAECLRAMGKRVQVSEY